MLVRSLDLHKRCGSKFFNHAKKPWFSQSDNGLTVEIGHSRSPMGSPSSYTKQSSPGYLDFKQSTFTMLYVGLTLVFLTGLAGGFLWGRQNNRFALQDPLTHLPNKPAFNQRLESLLENNGSSPEPLAILFLDIDHFKQINDCHGHLAGDEVLRQLGNLLATTGQPRNVFRWGGDEFTILSFGSRESVEQYAINIQQAIKQLAISQQSPPMLITVSIGVAQQTIDETGSQLLKRADQALYEAKRNGRNQVYWAASTTG